MTRLYLLAFTATIFLCPFSSFAAQSIVSPVEQWRCLEILLTSSKSYADPFHDIQVDAWFESDRGVRIKRPAFWDGGKTWKVRFAPPGVGTWQLHITSTDPDNTQLNAATDTFTCVPYGGSLEIFRRGFIKVSPNQRYFTFADGTPFFYLGDTHWLVSHERFSVSNVPGIASEFKYIVDKRV